MKELPDPKDLTIHDVRLQKTLNLQPVQPTHAALLWELRVRGGACLLWLHTYICDARVGVSHGIHVYMRIHIYLVPGSEFHSYPHYPL